MKYDYQNYKLVLQVQVTSELHRMHLQFAISFQYKPSLPSLPSLPAITGLVSFLPLPAMADTQVQYSA